MKKLLIFLIVALSFTACNNDTPVPIENYCDGIVMEKRNSGWHYKCYVDLKYNGIIIEGVKIYEIDYEKYSIGDTIKCTLETKKLYTK